MAVLFRRDSQSFPAEGRAAVAAGARTGAAGNAAKTGATGDTPGASAAAAETAGETEPTIEEVVQRRLVTAVFQPIVHLDSREIVGYEAFARGPAGTQWANPALMFGAAHKAGVDWELDLVAHTAAFKAALAARLPTSMSLFINANPSSVGRQVPADLAPTLALAYSRLRVFMEMSEQALAVDPDAFLSSIERARASGWGISLDNVGLTPNSLALVPFARPDVIKLDVSLVHEQTHPHAPRVMSSVTAHAERTGASIMALGIETEAHLRTGRGLGAVLGQGYLFGRPGPLDEHLANPSNAIPLIDALPPVDREETPFRLATADHPALPVTQQVLAALASHLEQRAALDQDPPVVLVCLPRAQMFSGAPLAYLQTLVRSASFLAAVVGEPPAHAIPDVRVIPLAENDPLRGEWSIILIGPHYSAMLTARKYKGENDEFGYRLVYDRPTVTRAARLVLQRVTNAAQTQS